MDWMQKSRRIMELFSQCHSPELAAFLKIVQNIRATNELTQEELDAVDICLGVALEWLGSEQNQAQAITLLTPIAHLESGNDLIDPHIQDAILHLRALGQPTPVTMAEQYLQSLPEYRALIVQAKTRYDALGYAAPHERPQKAQEIIALLTQSQRLHPLDKKNERLVQKLKQQFGL
jgi:hypothetical protein